MSANLNDRFIEKGTRRQLVVAILFTILNLFIGSDIVKKQVIIIKAVKSDKIKYKCLWCLLYYFQVMIKIIAILISFNVTIVSDSYGDAIGNIFGVVVLSELDSMASKSFQTYLELFHPKLTQRDDYLKI